MQKKVRIYSVMAGLTPDTMPTLSRSVHSEGRVHSAGGCSQGPRKASNQPEAAGCLAVE